MRNFLILITSVCILSCNKTTRINNSEEDVKTATELTTKFYKELSDLDTLKIYDYLDESILVKDLSKLINKNIKDYGSLQKVDIKNTKTTNITVNDKNEIDYTVETEVIYEKSKNIETISFKKYNDNDKVKLTYYLTQEVIE
jgi:hypothetical protein